MAKNPDTTRPNKNTCYVACSGYGKSQALGGNTDLPKKGVRVLLWDVDNDHKATHYENKLQFEKAIELGLKNRKPFRFAWSGRCDVETFEWWCGEVWKALDGRWDTYIVVEELADVSVCSGKASPNWGQLNRRCRKYGGILHWTTQRSQEISKTAFDQAAIKYIGYPNEGARTAHLCGLAGVSEPDLLGLKPLEFYRRHGQETKKIKFAYRKPPL